MRDLLLRCIQEDGGIGCDVTTNSLDISDAKSVLAIHFRGSGTIAGLNPIAEGIDVFGDVSITIVKSDGEVASNENVALLHGETKDILFAERTILNILGYASGVATRTKLFVDAIAGTNCAICNTRKTTPGLRLLDKYAVVCGGGTSHRLGLHDAALYKDNHLAELDDLQKDLGAAIACARGTSELQFVEVEVDTLTQLEKVLQLQVDIVLLDNMTTDLLREAVAIRDASGSSPLLEASGGVSLETVQSIAQTGVDRISIGGLTHQATWIDVGLDAVDG
jgi:nicotinate-nucleotide pyrophosphorylase (carboxylating)